MLFSGFPGNASMSSTANDRNASLAIDGDLTTCAETDAIIASNSWTIDLGEIKKIDHIDVYYNDGNSLTNEVEIRISYASFFMDYC